MWIIMAQHGAVLQTYNQELVKCIEDLKKRSAALELSIQQEEEEKMELEKEMELLSNKLAKINDSLSKNMATKRDYDRTISETEAAYTKILESSQVLLNMVRRESVCLDNAASKT